MIDTSRKVINFAFSLNFSLLFFFFHFCPNIEHYVGIVSKTWELGGILLQELQISKHGYVGNNEETPNRYKPNIGYYMKKVKKQLTNLGKLI